VPTVSLLTEGNTSTALSQVAAGLPAVRDPLHVWNLLAREPGDPGIFPTGGGARRERKGEEAIRNPR